MRKGHTEQTGVSGQDKLGLGAAGRPAAASAPPAPVRRRLSLRLCVWPERRAAGTRCSPARRGAQLLSDLEQVPLRRGEVEAGFVAVADRPRLVDYRVTQLVPHALDLHAKRLVLTAGAPRRREDASGACLAYSGEYRVGIP